MLVDASFTIGRFFEAYYVPVCMGAPRPATLCEYRQTLKYWAAMTGDPTIEALEVDHLVTFRTKLIAHDGINSANTVRKHLRQIQTILDRTGPTGPRRRDAAGLRGEVPWVKPPRGLKRTPHTIDEAHIVAFYACVGHATLPKWQTFTAAAWWRAFISLICSTSLRRTTVTTLPNDCIDWAGQTLHLPAELSTKSLRDQTFPLHPVALRMLLAVRGERELLLPWPHSWTNFYKTIDRIKAAAQIPDDKAFRPHLLRKTVLTEIAKINPAAAQQAAGHESVKTLLDHYLTHEVLGHAVNQLTVFNGFATG